MNTRTIAAVYDTEADAVHARERLLDEGLGEGDVRVVGHTLSRVDADASDDHERTLLDSIQDFLIGDEDRPIYSESLRRGGYLVTARVDETHADQVVSVLEEHNPVDLDERAQQWRLDGWSEDALSPPTSMSGYAPGAGPTTETIARELRREAQAIEAESRQADVAPEENVGTARVRVRTYIIEVTQPPPRS